MVYKNIVLPDTLNDLGLQFIKSVIDEFDKENRLKQQDQMALYMLANSFNQYLNAKEEEHKKGLTTVSPTGLISVAPWVKIGRDAQIQVNKLLDSLALNPVARKKLMVLENDANENESPLQQFMKASASLM